MMVGGQQVAVLNAFNPTEEFYEFIHAESNIRVVAPSMCKVYFIVLFACCRENYHKGKVKGFNQGFHRRVSFTRRSTLRLSRSSIKQ